MLIMSHHTLKEPEESLRGFKRDPHVGHMISGGCAMVAIYLMASTLKPRR